MGKSASGKDSISRTIAKKYTLKEIVLYTTRPIRSGECEGVNYHFTSVDDFFALEQAGKVIESRCYDTVQGKWYYYTVFDEQFTDPEGGDCLIIGTLESYVRTKEFIEKRQDASCKLIPVYIEVENGLRLERALGRERSMGKPDYAEMCRRFLADEKDFAEEKILAAGIERRFANVDLDSCLAEIGAMIEEG